MKRTPGAIHSLWIALKWWFRNLDGALIEVDDGSSEDDAVLVMCQRSKINIPAILVIEKTPTKPDGVGNNVYIIDGWWFIRTPNGDDMQLVPVVTGNWEQDKHTETWRGMKI